MLLKFLKCAKIFFTFIPMFPVRKRKLYTPVTPPEIDENEANKVIVVQQEQNSESNKIPAKKMCVVFGKHKII